MLARVEPTQEMWGAAGRPAARISATVSKVRSRGEPPAPKVTEKNAGSRGASFVQVARSFSVPSGVCGGKNSTESSMMRMSCLNNKFPVATHVGNTCAGDRAVEPVAHRQTAFGAGGA